MTPLFSMTRTGAARTAAATVFSLLAAGAGAQGVAGNGNGTPPGATTTSERENPATVPGGHAASAAGGKHGGGMPAARSKSAATAREGDLGRAPFGTGSRRHNAAAAGTPSAPPKGEAGGTAGTR